MPLAAGVGCASLVGRDPAAELQLAVPTPYRVTLLRRLAVTLGWTAAVARADRGRADRDRLVGPLAGATTARSPGSSPGSRRRSAWAPWVSRPAPCSAARPRRAPWSPRCGRSSSSSPVWSRSTCPGRLLYLFATTRGAVPGDWTANRLTLIGGRSCSRARAGRAGPPERLIGEGDHEHVRGAALRYEFRMQVRKRSVWIVPALTVVLFLLIGGSLLATCSTRTRRGGRRQGRHDRPGDPAQRAAADRVRLPARRPAVRDDRLRVAPVLDATPARHGRRGCSASTSARPPRRPSRSW